MLVFARQEHIQPARHQPHNQHAYPAGSLWSRLSPDQACVLALNPALAGSFAGCFPEHPADTAPGDWLQIESRAYDGGGGGRDGRSPAHQQLGPRPGDRPGQYTCSAP